MSFDDDFKTGRWFEEKWYKILKPYIQDLVWVQVWEKRWDLYSDNKNIGFEIKGDIVSQNTGRLVVEIEMPPGKPSALSTTKSKYWIFDTGREHFIVRSNDLKELIKDHKPDIFTGRGDKEPKKAYRIGNKYISKIGISLEDMLYEINTPSGLDGFC
jgi:hypothetical protein